jgi:transposase
MVRIVEDLVGDWSHLDERIENVTDEIEALARGSESCRQLSIMPGANALHSRTGYRRMIQIKRHFDLAFVTENCALAVGL